MAYPGFENLTNIGITEVLGFPNTGAPSFFGWFFFALWAILTLNPYFRQKETFGVANFLKYGAISSFVVAVLAIAGSLTGIVTGDLLKTIMALTMIFISVWYFSGRD